MKLTRRAAIEAHQGLQGLERGLNGKPFDFEFNTWNKIYELTTCLAPVAEAYNKARRQRFLAASNGEANLIGDAEIAFVKEEEALFDAMISVKMPKKLLAEDELKLTQNKIPPSVRIQIKAILTDQKPMETDGDENDY